MMSDRSHLAAGFTNLVERYTASATEYAHRWSPVIRPMGQRLIRAMPLAGADRVLDVGAGVGALVPDLRAAAPGALIVGVDGSMGMLQVARQTAPALLAAMDARRLGFRAESFDAALLAFVLFHLPNPVAGLIEVSRVLRLDGVIAVATWGQSPGFAASDVWDAALDAVGAGPDPVDSANRDDLMNAPDKLAALFDRAGLAVDASWSEGFEHRWDAETLMAQRVGFGSYRRRLETLNHTVRSACLADLSARLAALTTDDFVFRPQIVFAVGRRRG